MTYLATYPSNQSSVLNALFRLIDDPDKEVFDTVADKILGFGKEIIPELELLWENTFAEDTQDRIEQLIHKLNYTEISKEIISWSKESADNILIGALHVAKFQYPDLQMLPVLQHIESMRRNVWLELNDFLTPLEQANILSSIVYNFYQLKGVKLNYEKPDQFLINKVLETKKGNAVCNSILYQTLCNMVGIKAKIINVPKQMMVAFFKSDYDASIDKGPHQSYIQFYVDCNTGQAYSFLEVEQYLKNLGIPSNPIFYKPLSNKRIIQILLTEFAQCFHLPSNEYKQRELLLLAEQLEK